MPLTLSVKLLETHTLTFYRQGSTDIDDYWGDTVPATPLPDVVGSLQPIRAGLRVNIVPNGYDTDSGFFWYTTYDHVGYLEGSLQLPDYTVIDGRKYEVHNIEDWSGFGLNTDHNKYILVAKGMNAEGGGFS